MARRCRTRSTTATIVRRWRWAAATATALLLIGGSVLLAGTRPAGGTADALPDRVGVPPWGTLRITDPFPIDAAAVAVSGFGGDDAGTVAVVGAGAHRYRLHRVGVDAPVGEVVLLSPDGTRLAYQWDSPQGSTGVRIAHVGTRTAVTLAERDGDDWRLVGVDPATGADVPGPRLPTVPDVAAVRLATGRQRPGGRLPA